jgi:hypothetical protein
VEGPRSGKGGVVIDSSHPRYFHYEASQEQRYLPMGIEMDYLWALGLQSPDRVKDMVQNLSTFSINHIVVNL